MRGRERAGWWCICEREGYDKWVLRECGEDSSRFACYRCQCWFDGQSIACGTLCQCTTVPDRLTDCVRDSTDSLPATTDTPLVHELAKIILNL
jgi:hypothetical protein